MLAKVKDIMQTKELIDKLIGEIKKQQQSVSELNKEISQTKKELSEFRKSFDDIKKTNEDFVKNLTKDSYKIEELRNKCDNEISDFKLLKSRMQEKIFDKVDEKMKKYMEDIKINLSAFDEISKEAGRIKNDVSTASAEMRKLSEISRNLKAKDFELEKYARELSKMDSEKLALLRKIDNLEKLIAAERRRR